MPDSIESRPTDKQVIFYLSVFRSAPLVVKMKNRFSIITMSEIDDIIKIFPDTAKPNENDPMPAFEAMHWSDHGVIRISFEWSTATDAIVIGEYEYDVINKTISILNINEEIRG